MQQRNFRRLLVAGVTVVVVGAGSVAYAGLPHTFEDGPAKPLMAQDLNENFDQLDARLTGVETRPFAQVGTVRYSLGATYRAPSDKVKGGFASPGVSGYETAKKICATKIGSDTAHMCSSEEISRSRQMGVAVASGWYTSAAYFFNDSNKADSNECKGWTSSTQGPFVAPRWDAETQNGPSIGFCSDEHPILCCD